MERIERGLHYHLDQSFASLSRLITDKSDKVVDQVLRHLDHSDDKMERATKVIKGEIREFKKDAITRHREIKEGLKAVDGIPQQLTTVLDTLKELGIKIDALPQQLSTVLDTLKELGIKIDALEKKMDEESDSGSEREMVVRQPDESMRRRTESAHATLAHNEHRRRRPSHTSNGLRQGRQVSRGRQNSMDDEGGSGARRHGGRRIHGPHYTHVGVALRGEPPDIRQHPAYRQEQGQPPEHSQGASRAAVEFPVRSTSYQASSLQNGGWYHQAYGR